LRREVGEGEKNHAIDGLFQATISVVGVGLYIVPTPWDALGSRPNSLSNFNSSFLPRACQVQAITGEVVAAPVATVVEVVTRVQWLADDGGHVRLSGGCRGREQWSEGCWGLGARLRKNRGTALVASGKI
jgi:hypothetical protein